MERPKHREKKGTIPAGRPKGVLNGDYRGCTRKSAMSKKAAMKQAKSARGRTGGEPIYAYQCGSCGAWHIGHSKITEEIMKGDEDVRDWTA
jgi:hypothetical protein